MGRYRYLLWAAVLCGVGLICGCNKNDLTTPQAAAESFAKALEAGDADAAKAASTGADAKTIENLARLTHATKALHDLSMAQFGEKGGAVPPGFKGKEMPVRVLKDATVAINGETATLTPKDGGLPQRLKKVDGGWKVDLGDVSAFAAGFGAMMEPVAKAMEETAEDIKSGKLKTPDEANGSLAGKMMSGGK